MKTCEYCGSELPDETEVCPNCAAHFPSSALRPDFFRDEPWNLSQEPLPEPSRYDKTLRNIGLAAVVCFGGYMLVMFLGVLGSVGPILIVPAVLLAIAAFIVWRVR